MEAAILEWPILGHSRSAASVLTPCPGGQVVPAIYRMASLLHGWDTAILAHAKWKGSFWSGLSAVWHSLGPCQMCLSGWASGEWSVVGLGMPPVRTGIWQASQGCPCAKAWTKHRLTIPRSENKTPLKPWRFLYPPVQSRFSATLNFQAWMEFLFLQIPLSQGFRTNGYLIC